MVYKGILTKFYTNPQPLKNSLPYRSVTIYAYLITIVKFFIVAMLCENVHSVHHVILMQGSKPIKDVIT